MARVVIATLAPLNGSHLPKKVMIVKPITGRLTTAKGIQKLKLASSWAMIYLINFFQMATL
jgi:hypothetical protein